MIKKILLLAALLSAYNALLAQNSVLMPVNGFKDTTASELIIYDDGGANGNYSPLCNGKITVHAKQSTHRFKVLVHSYLQTWDWNKALITIYAGDTNSEVVFSEPYPMEKLFYVNSNTVSVEFTSDNDNTDDGFKIELWECGTQAPENVKYSFIDSTTVKISWDEKDTTLHWAVDYSQHQGYNPYAGEWIYASGGNGWGTNDFSIQEEYNFGDEANVQTAYSDTNFIIISNLKPGLSLSFDVYVSHDDEVIGCGGLYYYCPCEIPTNLNIAWDADSVFYSWDENDTSTVWSVHYYDPFSYNETEVYVYEPYITLPRTCYTYNLDISGNCDRLSQKFEKDIYCSYNSSILTPTLCPQLWSVGFEGVTPTSIATAWETENNSVYDTVSKVIVAYKKLYQPMDSLVYYDTVDKSKEKDTIYGLEPNTTYEVFLYTLCSGGPSCDVSRYITTTFDNCLDFTNLTGEKTFLTWGTYDDPYYNTWEANYDIHNGGTNKYFWGTGSHTVINDTSSYDWTTNGLLRCIAPDEIASVQLGSTEVGRKAESISYEYTVDTADKDMIVLKYAVVMQDPGHTKENQPRFTLEILDSNDNVIDTTCCFADFYAAGDLGWNEVENSVPKVIWKDWTTVGIDLAPYHEQTIHVRLTTYDCDEGGHFGYAYFNIKCDNKKIYVLNRCDGVDSVWLQAPLGFDYYWHQKGKTDTLSKTYEVKVPVDDNVYQCVASFVGKPSCNFTIETIPLDINPVAKASYKIDTCASKVIFCNESFLDFDSTQGVYTRQFVDTAFWIFEDGSISYQDTVEREYTANGLYDIKLVCRLSASQCTDTLHIPLNIQFNFNAEIFANDKICLGDSLLLTASTQNIQGMSYKWSTGDTASSITVYPQLQDTLYGLELLYNGTCGGSAYKHITVSPVYADTIEAQICQGETYNNFGFNESAAGQYKKHYQSQAGCDSITVLNLSVYPVYNINLSDTVCQGETYAFYGFEENATGVYVQNLTTENGCDSVITLTLEVCPVYDTVISADICQGTSYTENNFDEHMTGEYVQYLKSVNGCDSTVHLNLTVNPVYDTTIFANICNGETYTENNFNENQTGVYTQALQSVSGCDSTVTLNLTIRNNFYDTVFAIGCGEGYQGYGFDQEQTGIYTQELQSVWGCDSLVTLNFIRVEPFVDTLHVEIFKNETYDQHEFNESETGVYTNVFTDMYGCDSTLVLDLHVVELSFPNFVTPNGDGQNDIFEIAGLLDQSIYEENKLIIYTRYGKLIYEKENIRTKEDFWDPAATNTPDGSYFFRFVAKAKRKTLDFTGTIEVLR